MNKIKNVLYGVVSSALALAPAVASAQFTPNNGTSGAGLTNQSVGVLLATILRYILALVGVLGIIGFVVAGIYYITAAGDEEQVGKAKSIMLYSIIGVIVALIGWIAVTAISSIFQNTASSTF